MEIQNRHVFQGVSHTDIGKMALRLVCLALLLVSGLCGGRLTDSPFRKAVSECSSLHGPFCKSLNGRVAPSLLAWSPAAKHSPAPILSKDEDSASLMKQLVEQLLAQTGGTASKRVITTEDGGTEEVTIITLPLGSALGASTDDDAEADTDVAGLSLSPPADSRRSHLAAPFVGGKRGAASVAGALVEGSDDSDDGEGGGADSKAADAVDKFIDALLMKAMLKAAEKRAGGSGAAAASGAAGVRSPPAGSTGSSRAPQRGTSAASQASAKATAPKAGSVSQRGSPPATAAAAAAAAPVNPPAAAAAGRRHGGGIGASELPRNEARRPPQQSGAIRSSATASAQPSSKLATKGQSRDQKRHL